MRSRLSLRGDRLGIEALCGSTQSLEGCSKRSNPHQRTTPLLQNVTGWVGGVLDHIDGRTKRHELRSYHFSRSIPNFGGGSSPSRVLRAGRASRATPDSKAPKLVVCSGKVSFTITNPIAYHGVSAPTDVRVQLPFAPQNAIGEA